MWHQIDDIQYHIPHQDVNDINYSDLEPPKVGFSFCIHLDHCQYLHSSDEGLLRKERAEAQFNEAVNADDKREF